MDNIDNERYVKNNKIALIGCINGIFLYDLLWPFLIVVIMKLILGSGYIPFVENNENLASSILLVATSLITLLIAIVVAGPKRLIKAYKSFEKGDIKLILSSFGIMLLFNYIYNFILLVSGVDIIGGNANQSSVVELISSNAIMSFISMVILAPVLEEITYRYFLYGGIAKYNRKWAIIISGFIFMCVHAVASFSPDVDNIFRELILLPPYMFSGIVLAYVYDKKENLLISTSIHLLNNLISFILCLI